MPHKIYKKRGNKNYKEKRLLKEINEFLDKNPELAAEIEPTEDFDGLQAIYDKYVFDDHEVVDSTSNSTGEKTEQPEEVPVEEFPKKDMNVDPLNRQNPNVRDYVLDNANDKGATGVGAFAEPVDFTDAFELPETSKQEPDGKTTEQPKKEKRIEVEQFQPRSSGAGGDHKKRKRKTERFARSVVNLSCDLLEKGALWFATKDISEQKLLEYEQEFGMDLSLILEMPDSTTVTIRQFFASQRIVAEQNLKISKEEREDLTEALVEVFLEKNIQPTPTQNLILVGLAIVGRIGLTSYAISAQNNMVISQTREEAEARPAPPPPPPAPTSEPTEPTVDFSAEAEAEQEPAEEEEVVVDSSMQELDFDKIEETLES